MTEAASVIDLRLEHVQISGDGVKSYCWPLDINANEVVRSKLLAAYADFAASNDSILVRAVTTSFKWFVVEVLRSFESVKLANNAALRGMTFKLPPHYHYLRAAIDSSEIAQTVFSKLAVGAKDRHHLMSYVRRAVKEKKWNGYSINQLIQKKKSGLVCALSPSRVTLLHAKEEGRYLSYARHSDWFDKSIALDQLRQPQQGMNAAHIENLLEIVESAFASGDCRFELGMRNYFRNWLNECVNFYQFHTNRLRSEPQKLPKELWLGCAGASLWNCILSDIVREAGGQVVAHDHGTANAHIDQLQTHFVELLHCDKYITFNPFVAKIKSDEVRKEYLFNRPTPKIGSIINRPTVGGLANPRTSQQQFPKKIKNVMYVGTAFHSEGARFRPIIPDLTYVDWQGRLLAFMQSQGISGYYKPHPEGRTQAAEGFSEQFGFKRLTARFEEIEEEVDAYVIDFIASSTTSFVMQSDRPVIFVDPGYPELLGEASSLIDGRCYHLKAYFDDINRMQIDWDELGGLFERSSHEFSYFFPEKYFSIGQ